jgi:hypothetical protein
LAPHTRSTFLRSADSTSVLFAATLPSLRERTARASTLLEAIAYRICFHTGGGRPQQRVRVGSVEADLGGAIRLSFLPNTSQIIFLGVESFNSIHQSSPKRLPNGNFSFYLLGMAPIYGLIGKRSI